MSPFTTCNFCLGKKKSIFLHKSNVTEQSCLVVQQIPLQERKQVAVRFSQTLFSAECKSVRASGFPTFPPTGTTVVSTLVSRQKWQVGTGNELTLTESGPAAWQHAGAESRLLRGFWELGCCCHHPLQLLLTGLGDLPHIIG